MDQQLVLVALLVAVAVFLVGIAGFVVLSERGKKRVQRRIDELRTGELDPEAAASVLRDQATGPIETMLGQFAFIQRISQLLSQANSNMTVGSFLLVTVLGAILGGFLAWFLSGFWWAAFPGAVIVAFIPYMIVFRKKQQRKNDFERQFPDALDLMCGALRSGMAFVGALQIVSEESPNPVGEEFGIVFDEQRLGMPMREALEGMPQRIDSIELRLFITAVLIQRETGGNLAEILEGTAEVIRDRFRILGDVKTITAQARFSGLVLTILPLVMAVFLIFTAPDYMKTLITDPIGPYLIAGAVFLQIVGFIAIRQIINIKV